MREGESPARYLAFGGVVVMDFFLIFFFCFFLFFFEKMTCTYSTSIDLIGPCFLRECQAVSTRTGDIVSRVKREGGSDLVCGEGKKTREGGEELVCC